MISVEDAYALIMGDARPVEESETIALKHAYGRILARDVVALRTQPAFDASAMDGYAARAEDTASPFPPLAVIGESAAGRAFDGRISAGQTVRIFTGAPVPQGADAILIQENAEVLGDGRIRATEPVEPGCHIRRAGMDFSEGAVLLARGGRIGSGAVALAASGGHPHVEVLRKPRVAIVATGDELVFPGEAVGASQIVASNSFGVAAMVEAAGGTALDYGIACDREAEIASRLDRAVREGVDVFVTIGGASVGDHDLVGRVFAQRGVELDFWKVAMRPGKPLMAGRLGAMRLVGLPGNPASSMVAAALFLRPLVQALAGRPEAPAYRRGILGADMPQNDRRADFIRAALCERDDGQMLVTSLGRQDSSLLSIYARADALLVRPPYAPAAKAGEACRYVVLD